MAFILALIALILGVLVIVKVVADSALIVGAALILLALAILIGAWPAVQTWTRRPPA